MAVLTLGSRWESGSASTFNPSLEFQSCLCGESQKPEAHLKLLADAEQGRPAADHAACRLGTTRPLAMWGRGMPHQPVTRVNWNPAAVVGSMP